MQPIPYTLTNDSITLIVDGQPKVVRKGDPQKGGAQYIALRAALFAEEWESALELSKSPAPALAQYLSEAGLGAYTLDGTTLKFGDIVVPADITKRIDAMLTKGESPAPLLRFFDRLQQNPSWRSVTQLFPFLNRENIPIEADGTFLAYKGVNADLTDKHTGKVDNSPGVTNELPRNQISDDPNETCHFGFHVGALGYASGSYFGADRTVVCRVAPEDVVCVPNDHSAQKMRVCKYEVIGFYGGVPLPSTSVKAADVIDDEFDDSDDEPASASRYNGDGDNYIDDDESTRTVAHTDDEDTDDEDEEVLAPVPVELTLNAEEEEILLGGNIIGAIKAMRVRIPGSGLRDCKDACDKVRNAQPKTPVAAEQTTPPRKGRSAPVDCSSLDSRKLLDQTIDSLRAYAAQLKIVGASKLPGGKAALVKQISKARRR